MSSLAAVHTAAALVVRALGDAGVSADVTVELDVNGIVVRPLSIEPNDWRIAIEALTDALAQVTARPYGLIGQIDDVVVTASDVRLEVIA